MSRNKEKQKNVLNRLHLAKTNPSKCVDHSMNLGHSLFSVDTKVKRPHLVSASLSNGPREMLISLVTSAYRRRTSSMDTDH